MAHAIDRDDPEHVIAILNRNRQIKVVAVVVGLVVTLGVLFFASAAMYSEDPAARVLHNAK